MTTTELVTQFYAQVLSKTADPGMTDRLMAALAPSWQSIGDYSGAAKTREQFAGQLQGFGKLIPDLTWAIDELIVAGDRAIVRGKASGKPVGELFGVPATGKAFTIMSMDIHTIADGKIARTYHVEDWAGALRQLR